ncbi:MAG: hypothetical protein AAF849_11550 [Bacteroidota bacterium]
MDKGWQSKEGHELLEAIADDDIDALMTADRNLEFQQNMEKYNFKLIVLMTRDNRYKMLKAKVPQIEKTILEANESEQIIPIDLTSK